MRKAIFFVGGGLETVPGIQLASKMGYYVVVSDRSNSAPGMQFADHAIQADTYDSEQTARLAHEFHKKVRPLHGVMCMASDVPSTVAAVATRLNLRAVSQESAGLTMNKLAMKDKFAAGSIPIPWYRNVESAQHLEDLIRQKNSLLVLKPVDSRGARGVFLLTRNSDYEQLFKISLNHSPSQCCMVEEFLSGPQVSTESLFVDGRLHTPGFSDRNYDRLQQFAPNIIEDGGQLPSFLSGTTQEGVRKLVEDAAACLNIDFGVVKGDIVIHNNKPYVIELAARLSGGYFCSHEIPLNTGVDFVGAAIKTAVGDKVEEEELQQTITQGVAQRYLFPKPGVVRSISGVEEVESWQDIKMCEIRVAIGDTVGPVHSHPARAGVIIAVGDSRQSAVELAEKAIRTIQIETYPVKE